MRAEPPSHAEPIPAIEKLSSRANGARYPADSDSLRHVPYGLHDSLQHADLVFADRNQQGQRRADIEQSGKHSAPGDRARQGTSRILNLVSHDGSQFQTHQSETNHAKRVQHEPRIRRDPKVSRSDGGAKSHPDDQTQSDQAAAAMPVPIPPRLLTHFPTPRPTIFSTTRMTSSNSDAISANGLLSAKA